MFTRSQRKRRGHPVTSSPKRPKPGSWRLGMPTLKQSFQASRMVGRYGRGSPPADRPTPRKRTTPKLHNHRRQQIASPQLPKGEAKFAARASCRYRPCRREVARVHLRSLVPACAPQGCEENAQVFLIGLNASIAGLASRHGVEVIG